MILLTGVGLLALGVRQYGGKAEVSIKGKWKLTKVVYDGNPREPGERDVGVITPTNIIYGAETGGAKDEYKLNPNESPAQIELKTIRPTDQAKIQDGKILL